MQYRKKPVLVEAYQLPQVGEDVPESFYEWCEQVGFMEFESGRDETLIILTPEGDMTAEPGDWIIKGVKGELYPCKPDIFAATYEAAAGQQDTSDYVSCGCGDMYPPDSYDAGYIHGAGQCANCEAGQPHAGAIRDAALEDAARAAETYPNPYWFEAASAHACDMTAVAIGKGIRALKSQSGQQDADKVDADSLRVAIARAICVADGADPDQVIWQGNPPEPYGDVLGEYLGQADAAIAVINAARAAKGE